MQRADEHVIIMLRQHWIIWFKYIAQLILFNALPVALFLFFIYVLKIQMPTQGPGYVSMIMLASLYYLSAWLMYFHQFVDYRLDVWILTDQRIVNIEQRGLFDRVIAELNIHKVQDVTSEVHGHAQTFLDYGNVYIQTAGEKQRFIFQNIPHPEEVARLVTRTNDASLKNQGAAIHGHHSPAHSAGL